MNNNGNQGMNNNNNDAGAQKLNNLANSPNRVSNMPNSRLRPANRFVRNPLNRNGLDNNSQKSDSRQPLRDRLGRKVNNGQPHQSPSLGAPKPGNNDGSGQNNGLPGRSGLGKKGDTGANNLRNSLANKAKNLSNLRNKRKKNANNVNADPTTQNNSNNNSSNGSDNSTSNNSNEDDNKDKKNSFEAKLKRKIMIKLAIAGAFAFMFFALIIIVGSALTGGSIFSAPAESSSTYDTDEFQSLTEDDDDNHQKELDYYEKLKDIKKNHDDKVANLVNAILLVYYYQYQPEEEDEDLENISGIDFENMKDNADDFVSVITNANSDDYSVNGPIYVKVRDSSKFEDYYENLLKTKSKDDIMVDIFKLADDMEGFGDESETVITSETSVTVTQTSSSSSSSSSSSKTTTVSMSDYILDSIYASSDAVGNDELVKAYTVAYSTNVISQNKKLSINSSNAKVEGDLCSVKEGCSYNDSDKLVNGPGKQNEKNATFYGGKYYYKRPLSEEEIATLKKIINSVYGNVLVNADGSYPLLDISKINGLGDEYQEILKTIYGDDYRLKNVGEDSYISDGSYGAEKVLTDVIFYDQNDYASYKFCGLKNETIKSSGCGIVAMAMVVSTIENDKKYDPLMMNTEAMNRNSCGSGTGTAQAFFGRIANAMNYKYIGGSKYNKSLLNTVLKHLAEGHLVVVRMGSGHFTSSGHYMVLGGVDPETKKVYVYDPNNKSNSSWRKTGNGWYSFNDIIVKEAYNFYIIWKG